MSSGYSDSLTEPAIKSLYSFNCNILVGAPIASAPLKAYLIVAAVKLFFSGLPDKPTIYGCIIFSS